MHRLSQFPTPYPDECYYSILCRYYQRMGYLSFDRTMKSLFGKTHHTDMFILLPYLAAHVNDWTGNYPNLNADVITKDHTAFFYCSLTEWAWYKRSELKERLWNGSMKYHTGFLTVRKEQLYYCQECVNEEIRHYGEAYWHRLHQIGNVKICDKHRILLRPSGVTYDETKRAFIPASTIVRSSDNTLTCKNQDFRNEMRFAEDIKWILKNGDKLPSDGILRKYVKSKKYTLNEKGFLKTSEINLKDFENFFRNRGGEKLFGQSYLRVQLQNEYMPLWIFDYYKPMMIVLMMEYLEGSAEAFCNEL